MVQGFTESGGCLMTDPKKAEYSGLGAEAIPAGLTEINGTLQAWAEAGSRGQRSPLRESRPTGLIAIAARWMQEAIRLNPNIVHPYRFLAIGLQRLNRFTRLSQFEVRHAGQ